MATLNVETLLFTGLQYAAQTPSVADVFTNDGNTILLILNSNASARTLTIAGNAFSKPGFGDISAADAGEVITIPGSGTNGGRFAVGTFPTGRFNNSSGQVSYTIDNVTGLTVSVIKLNPYA